MSTAALIERFLAGELAGTEAPDEAAWYGLWCGADLGALPPPIAALHGGLLADRLAWVFVAGYQAAVRSVFPEVPSTGWA
ncbi:MAG: hypothetical protein QF491_05405, partial [Alphaproteobacteria bacterium]|nr:hypothetical protein [Alphaproteobacteria bacterium]